MNDVIQNILSRRSVRSFTQEQLSEEQLSLILDAARYAPSGGNSQSWRFTVVQNPELLSQLNACVRNAFREFVVDENTYKSLRAGKLASQNEEYSFYFHAPTLIIVSNEREYPNAMADSAIAMENILLSAHSLGLGACYVNQLRWFGDHSDIRSLMNTLRIPSNHMICCSAAIGFADRDISKAPPRREGTVEIFR